MDNDIISGFKELPKWKRFGLLLGVLLGSIGWFASGQYVINYIFGNNQLIFVDSTSEISPICEGIFCKKLLIFGTGKTILAGDLSIKKPSNNLASKTDSTKTTDKIGSTTTMISITTSVSIITTTTTTSSTIPDTTTTTTTQISATSTSTTTTNIASTTVSLAKTPSTVPKQITKSYILGKWLTKEGNITCYYTFNSDNRYIEECEFNNSLTSLDIGSYIIQGSVLTRYSHSSTTNWNLVPIEIDVMYEEDIFKFFSREN